MTLDELKTISEGQRIRMFFIDDSFIPRYRFGKVVGIYNGNYQIKVHFDKEPKPRTVGYTQIEIVNEDQSIFK